MVTPDGGGLTGRPCGLLTLVVEAGAAVTSTGTPALLAPEADWPPELAAGGSPGIVPAALAPPVWVASLSPAKDQGADVKPGTFCGCDGVSVEMSEGIGGGALAA